MTELKVPELTPEEQAHIAKGGRVFTMEEIAGPLWRVLMVKGSTCKVLGMDGYSDYEDALLNALAGANLAEDIPLVRR